MGGDLRRTPCSERLLIFVERIWPIVLCLHVHGSSIKVHIGGDLPWSPTFLVQSGIEVWLIHLKT